jgi:hypothetical protein
VKRDHDQLNPENQSNINQDILNFLNNLNQVDDKHIALFYEEPELAKTIEYRLLSDGLLKGQHCLLILPENNSNIQTIEYEMKDIGIDVKGYKKRNLLHILPAPNVMNHPKGPVEGFFDIMSNDILAGLIPPFRLVARLVPDIRTKVQIEANINIERKLHAQFHDFPGGLFLCPYRVDNIEPETHGKWLFNILSSHDAAFFAPKSGRGIAFNIR